ncbi:MAG: ROK family protein [Marinilabiliaceae bacterium]
MESILFNKVLLERLSGLEKKKFLLSVRILKFLYFHGNNPVADICRYLKISTPNGISILGELMERDLIEKKGYGASKGGRKPELYGLCKDAFYVLGVDMNIHRTQLSIFNSNNERITEIGKFDLELDNDRRTAEILVDEIEKYLKKTGIDRDRIIGTGVSFPGLVDAPNGENHTYLNFDEKPIASFLQEQLQLPVFVENDAKAVTLAVWRFGVARNQKDVLVLLLDWGIGLGMILNGKLYRGDSGFAGEFSHIPMVENGESCICGKNGCLETVAAGSSLVKRAKEGIIEGKSSLMAHFADEQRLNEVDLATVVDAALKGDQFAIHLLSDTGEYLGKGIAILIQLFNPGMIVLGGKMAEAGHFLTIPIQQSINTYSMHQISERVTIRKSDMGKDIGLNGAMSVVMEDVFDLLAKYPTKLKKAVT